MSWLYASSGQIIGASASKLVPEMNIQDCFGYLGFFVVYSIWIIGVLLYIIFSIHTFKILSFCFISDNLIIQLNL